MKNENGDSIYYNKDGRLRVYVRETGKTISYPRYLIEQELDRKLLPGEDVHHIDEDPLNNELSNLRVMSHSEHAAIHARKFFDTTAICGWCGREFLWTAKHQKNFYSNKRNHGQESEMPFCSRECSGKYGRQKQVMSESRYRGRGRGRSSRRKLTDEQIRYIRENYIPYDKEFGERAIAKQFGVDHSVIDLIIKGRTYTDIL